MEPTPIGECHGVCFLHRPFSALTSMGYVCFLAHRFHGVELFSLSELCYGVVGFVAPCWPSRGINLLRPRNEVSSMRCVVSWYLRGFFHGVFLESTQHRLWPSERTGVAWGELFSTIPMEFVFPVSPRYLWGVFYSSLIGPRDEHISHSVNQRSFASSSVVVR